ncbi:MAG: hypothetical protein F4208_13680, partial [Gemmatimonadales bacterium]|nr:hypothetical protein [Gemmatimonadales bacterium]
MGQARSGRAAREHRQRGGARDSRPREREGEPVRGRSCAGAGALRPDGRGPPLARPPLSGSSPRPRGVLPPLLRRRSAFRLGGGTAQVFLRLRLRRAHAPLPPAPGACRGLMGLPYHLLHPERPGDDSMYQLSVPRLRRPSSALIPLAVRFLLPLALFLLSVSLLLPTASHAQDREVQVTVSEGTNMAAAVSPDGSRIVLDLQGTLWVMDAGGGEARAITDMYYDARQPQWAPDGSRIVFQSFRDGRWHIWSIASDGTDPVQHTFGPYDEREPAYSPDGGAIVFASDRSGNYDIWTLDVSGGPGDGRIQRVTDAPTHEFTPQWSPDGESLAYASDRGLGAIIVRESGGSTRVVARNAGAISPAWSPDGSRIAYSAVVQGQTGLWVADAGAGGSGAAGGGGAATPTRLTEAGADVFPFRPMWTGDRMGDGTEAVEIAYTGDGRI